MKVSVLCTDPHHPVNKYLLEWKVKMALHGNLVSIHRERSELTSGTILFLVSCSELVTQQDRAKYDKALVLHASDLPQGRGWSPYIWEILKGSNVLDVCMIEAVDPVDSGDIWFKERIYLEGHELLPEINERLFEIELALMTRAINEFGAIQPRPQVGETNSYCRRRTQEDSRLDVGKSLAEQFNTLRVVDSDRFPAFFEYAGRRYLLKIEKA